MDWRSAIKGFQAYLKLEKSLSGNSIEAYSRDIEKLYQFADSQPNKINPDHITLSHLRAFIVWVNELGMIPSRESFQMQFISMFGKFREEVNFENKYRLLLDLFKLQIVFAGISYS